MQSQLVAQNFSLTSQVAKLKAEIAALKAVREAEVAEEVDRITTAYMELEKEVVQLRIRERERAVELKHEHVTVSSSSSDECVVALQHQLQQQIQRYAVLEEKYGELRKQGNNGGFYSGSTCASSPASYVVEDVSKAAILSVVGLPAVVLGVQREEMFRSVEEVERMKRRTVLSSNEGPKVQVKRAPASTDGSIKRLAKISRFKL